MQVTLATEKKLHSVAASGKPQLFFALYSFVLRLNLRMFGQTASHARYASAITFSTGKLLKKDGLSKETFQKLFFLIYGVQLQCEGI